MSSTTETAAPIGDILVCGGGLAAQMAIAMLARHLPADIRLTWLVLRDDRRSDLFYGTVSAPSAYALNLGAGVDEPSLALRSDATFSWGTRYIGWGGQSWTQCFTLPLPIVDGLPFHHYLTAAGIARIEPFLAGAQAAARGVFAHPPSAAAGQHPLTRAEYGYHLDPERYAGLFAAALPAGRVTTIEGEIVAVTTGADGITGIRLRDGRTCVADLYVDASGPDAMLLSPVGSPMASERRLALLASDRADGDGAPLRTVTATPWGWDSVTPLHGRTRHLSLYDPSAEDGAHALHGGDAVQAELSVGRRATAWAGNCVGIGHAAQVREPVTPAPLMLLERDIERLMALIPNAGGMAVERREYNRRFDADATHAALFERALFVGEAYPDTAYWRAARAVPVPEQLARKIALFERRGVSVSYDLEPFHPEDWIIQHLGIGRRPARPDPLVDRVAPAQVRRFLDTMQHEVDRAVAGLPPAGRYRTQFDHYLRQHAR